MFLFPERKLLTRYWIEFPDEDVYSRRFGVTAYNIDDAFRLIQNCNNFGLDVISSNCKITINIDISDIFLSERLWNMGVCCLRGVWYPAAYMWQIPRIKITPPR